MRGGSSSSSSNNSEGSSRYKLEGTDRRSRSRSKPLPQPRPLRDLQRTWEAFTTGSAAVHSPSCVQNRSGSAHACTPTRQNLLSFHVSYCPPGRATTSFGAELITALRSTWMSNNAHVYTQALRERHSHSLEPDFDALGRNPIVISGIPSLTIETVNSIGSETAQTTRP